MNTIILKYNVENLKGMTTIDEFFEITGVSPYIKDKKITDVRQMKMNRKDEQQILEYWNNNWKKIKEVRGMRERYVKSKIAMTWMNYSPCIDDKIKSGEIQLSWEEE